jgi:hypothetical protein
MFELTTIAVFASAKKEKQKTNRFMQKMLQTDEVESLSPFPNDNKG